MLKITTDMVIDLAERIGSKDAKIALTSEGWSVEVDTVGAYPDGLTAMTVPSTPVGVWGVSWGMPVRDVGRPS